MTVGDGLSRYPGGRDGESAARFAVALGGERAARIQQLQKDFITRVEGSVGLPVEFDLQGVAGLQLFGAEGEIGEGDMVAEGRAAGVADGQRNRRLVSCKPARPRTTARLIRTFPRPVWTRPRASGRARRRPRRRRKYAATIEMMSSTCWRVAASSPPRPVGSG